MEKIELNIKGNDCTISHVHTTTYRVTIKGWGYWFLLENPKDVVKSATKTLKEIFKNGNINWNPKRGDKFLVLKDISAFVGPRGNSDWSPSGSSNIKSSTDIDVGSIIVFDDKSSWNQQESGYGYVDFIFNGVRFHVRKMFWVLIMSQFITPQK